jgi:murein DD-endopeptidase MepM/ murein hydrolase activator NlpD
VNARALLVIAALVALVGGGYMAAGRFEGTPPSVVAPEQLVVGKAGATLSIEIEDPASGLRELSIRLLHEAGSQPLSDHSWPGGLIEGGLPGGRTASIEIEVDPVAQRLPDGKATLVISVRDWSWRDGFSGNRTELSVPVVIDTRPPRVSVQSGLTYVYRGGSAAAVYRVDSVVPVDGIRVGNTFFPGHPHPADAGARIALFAIPVDAASDPLVEVVATDEAGNEDSVRFPARVIERQFARSQIDIDETFIARVAAPLARTAGLPVVGPSETFRGVNEELRARNERMIRERVQDGAARPLWSGAFTQLAGSKVMSRFAEHRTYNLGGRKISQARHFGFDLASTTAARITAANAGVVIFAEDLGIYGNCVIVDHGLGLATLYGHLSQIEVETGQSVAQGDVLGRSGISGLAAGDHLHFATLVGGTYVDPLEWWDPKWVRTHVGVRLDPSPR